LPWNVYIRPEYFFDPYWVDIYIHPHWIIEVDGREHNNGSAQRGRDLDRDAVLRGLGKTVIRVRNEEIDMGVESAVERVKLLIFPPQPAPDSSIFRAKNHLISDGRLFAAAPQ
jgi:very-short-patch-repair endonuclease